MPRSRTALEQAAGKLILRIQQEWMLELGEPAAADSEQVMNRAHDLPGRIGRPARPRAAAAVDRRISGQGMAARPSWVQPFVNDLAAQLRS
jgi:hypothetical protein